MSRRRAVQRRVDVEALKVLALPLVGVLLVVGGVVIGPADTAPTGPREVSLVSSVAACPLQDGLTASVGQPEAGDASEITALAGPESTTTELDPSEWNAAAGTGDAAADRRNHAGVARRQFYRTTRDGGRHTVAGDVGQCLVDDGIDRYSARTRDRRATA